MSNKMLLVVDFQKDFVDGALGFPGAEKLDGPIAEKVLEYAKNGDIVAMTQDAHSSNYLSTREGKALPVPHCICGSDGFKPYGETGKALFMMATDEKLTDNLVVLPKTTFGVAPQDMVEKMSDFDIKEIEVVGLVTNMCVLANVCCFQAMWPDAQITVDAALVDSFDKDLHQKTLDVLRGMHVIVD